MSCVFKLNHCAKFNSVSKTKGGMHLFTLINDIYVTLALSELRTIRQKPSNHLCTALSWRNVNKLSTPKPFHCSKLQDTLLADLTLYIWKFLSSYVNSLV